MNRYILASTTIFLCITLPLCNFKCFAQARTQTLQTVTFEQVERLFVPNADTVKIINFWATTCAPCVKELPAFDKVQREQGKASANLRPVKVYLVSLDFKRDVQLKVIPFLKRRAMLATPLFLGPPTSPQIDRVDSSWSGAMPATLMVGSGKHLFFEKSFTYNELITTLQPLRKIQP
jgi:thiol-disulfide isomerase/thioredoxin